MYAIVSAILGYQSFKCFESLRLRISIYVFYGKCRGLRCSVIGLKMGISSSTFTPLRRHLYELTFPPTNTLISLNAESTPPRQVSTALVSFTYAVETSVLWLSSHLCGWPLYPRTDGVWGHLQAQRVLLKICITRLAMERFDKVRVGIRTCPLYLMSSFFRSET